MTDTPPAPLFNIVLHEPEIPNNTGNIGRTCIATHTALHLVHPLAFDTSEKALRRAGLDYWPRLNPAEHHSWQDATTTIPLTNTNTWLLTTKATTPIWHATLNPGDALVFGKETKGLPPHILEQFPERHLCLPLAKHERSLNLATAVCAAIYEGIRQLHANNHITIDPTGRIAPPRSTHRPTHTPTLTPTPRATTPTPQPAPFDTD